MIAIDSCSLIDLLSNSEFSVDTERVLRQALLVGPVVVSDVVLAETCTALRDGTESLGVIEGMGLRYALTEARSAMRAGEMQRRFRARGGRRERVVADFLVGAHALMQCQGLITRDAGFYRDYFKGLKLIVPKA